MGGASCRPLGFEDWFKNKAHIFWSYPQLINIGLFCDDVFDDFGSRINVTSNRKSFIKII